MNTGISICLRWKDGSNALWPEAPAEPIALGECCWCGQEVPIFGTHDCTADPKSPSFIGFVS